MERGERTEDEWRAIFATIDLVDSPGHVFRVVENRIHERYYQLTPRPDISPRQIAVLRMLFQIERATQTELAGHISLDRSTLSEMSSRMIDRGLLSRAIAKHDRRALTLEITAEGKRALFEAIGPVLQAQREVIAVIPDELRPVFMRCLRILYSSVGEHPPEAAEEKEEPERKKTRQRKKA